MRRGESRRIHYTLRELDRLTGLGMAGGLTREAASKAAGVVIRSANTKWTVIARETGEQAAPTKGSYDTVAKALNAMVAMERNYGSIFELRSQ